MRNIPTFIFASSLLGLAAGKTSLQQSKLAERLSDVRSSSAPEFWSALHSSLTSWTPTPWSAWGTTWTSSTALAMATPATTGLVDTRRRMVSTSGIAGNPCQPRQWSLHPPHSREQLPVESQVRPEWQKQWLPLQQSINYNDLFLLFK